MLLPTEVCGSADGRMMPGAQNALRLMQLQGRNTPQHQTLIKFYFCCFKGNLLFISVQIYLIISMKEECAADGDIPGENFNSESFIIYKCNFQPFASDRMWFADNVGGCNFFLNYAICSTNKLHFIKKPGF